VSAQILPLWREVAMLLAAQSRRLTREESSTGPGGPPERIDPGEAGNHEAPKWRAGSVDRIR